MNLKKYLLYKLSSAQAEVAMLEEQIKALPAEGDATAAAPTKNEKKNGKGSKGAAAPAKNAADDALETAHADSEAAGDALEGGEGEADDLDMDLDGGDASDEPTLDDVRKVVKDFATKHGKEKALKLLGKFKVTSIPDIKKGDYAKVIELAKKHL